ncbi:MAG: hypothetical protein WC958_03645 [Dehalococcoidales bacterium]
MTTEIGEYMVGACLKLLDEFQCDFVEYNIRRPGGKLAGLKEIDVIGLKLKDKEAYLCEVTTHLGGLLYVNNTNSIKRINDKFNNLRDYAEKYLSEYKPRFMLWSPKVSASVANELEKIDGLELVINGRYTSYIRLLEDEARKGTHDTGNPVFRVLQILGHLVK